MWAEQTLSAGHLAAPHLMPVEAANILRRATLAGEVSADTASMAHDDLLALRVELFPYGPLAARVWELPGVPGIAPAARITRPAGHDWDSPCTAASGDCQGFAMEMGTLSLRRHSQVACSTSTAARCRSRFAAARGLTALEWPSCHGRFSRPSLATQQGSANGSKIRARPTAPEPAL